jgi:hypothetical protein
VESRGRIVEGLQCSGRWRTQHLRIENPGALSHFHTTAVKLAGTRAPEDLGCEKICSAVLSATGPGTGGCKPRCLARAGLLHGSVPSGSRPYPGATTLTRTEGKADLQAGSATVSCSGEHKCRGDNCSYDCHLQGHAIPAPMLLTAAQEIRFESFINQAFRVKVE